MYRRLENFAKDLQKYFWKKAFVHALNFLDCPQMAQDIASESILTVLAKVETYDLLERFTDPLGRIKLGEDHLPAADYNGQRLSSLLNRIVYNKCINQWHRSKKIRLPGDGSNRYWTESQTDPDINLDPKPSQEHWVFVKSNQLLSDKQLEIFQLKMIDNYTLTEIAGILNLNYSTVIRRWRHIVQKFRAYQQLSKLSIYNL